MKLLIDLPKNLEYLYNFVNTKRPNGRFNEFDKFDTYDISKCIRNGIPFPNNATNGDIIKALFPNIETFEPNKYEIAIKQNLGWLAFKKDWWNAPYKENKE